MKKINYLYFGIYFLLLVLMSASGIFVVKPLAESRFFFFLYSMGQAALETCFLIAIGYFLERLTNRTLFLAYIGATFFLFILHVLDFLMNRILDLSIWETISFVLDETFANFLFLLDASGIPTWLWVILFTTLLLLPFLGIALYKITEKITQKYPLPLPKESLPLAIFCIPVALMFWDFSASRVIHPNTYTAFLQSLPWKFTLLQPKNVILETPYLPTISYTKKSLEKATSEITLSQNPNIYLFVIESFREDFITPEVAPNLFAFKQLCAPIDLTLSNANASHLSWFSIFHSQFSHNWHLLQQTHWNMGSPALYFLKNLGYQIHLYSSAQLGYYGMEKLLFGENNSLLSSYQKFHHIPPLSAAETDAEALKTMQKDLKENPAMHKGQIFLMFWDATHFDYSWPKNWAPKFVPFASELAYFKAFYSQKRIHQIKNRYRNAVHYVDHLFGEFIQNIPNKEEAIIIVTGDHGEEFFEHGHLFHGSHLVQEQTNIPIYMKFGEKIPKEKRVLASQMDIFPSLIDYLSGKTPSFLQGQSIFRETKWPFAVISRFNAGRTPYELCIHNGKNKCIAQFIDRKNILQSNALQIMSLQSFNDKTLPESHKDVQAWIDREFGPAIQGLFSPNRAENE